METTEPQTMDETAEWLLKPENPVETEVEEVEVEAEPDDTEEEVETAEADEADDAEEEAEDDAEQEAEEEPQLFSVKVDGADVEVTLEELTRGYAGQAYIQKGMSEAAEARKQAESQRAEIEQHYNALSQERSQLAQLVQNLQQGGLQEPQKPPIELMNSDPIGYIEAKAQYDDALEQYQSKQNAVREQLTRSQQAQAQAQQAYLQEQVAILKTAIPEYADPVKGPQIQRELRDTGTSYGFKAAEIEGITDARMVQVLRDAMLYRKTIAKTAEVTAKAATARPVVKPKAKPRVPSNERLKQDITKKMTQTGHVNDVTNWLLKG